MDQSLDRFLRHIQYEKRFSQHTITAYRDDITQFIIYLKQQFDISQPSGVSHSFIRSWIVSLMEEKLNTRSVNRKISSLRSFFRFLLREKLIPANPMLKVIAPKNAKKLPVFVEKQNINLLFDHVVTEPDFMGIRDRMVLELFYTTGMRLSELISLKISDISFYNSTVKVLGKRNKERIIPLTNAIQEPLKNYISLRNAILHEKKKNSNELFINGKGDKLNSKTVYLLVKKYLSQVTTLEKKSPHVLRHTFATHMLNNGADINAIKEILGHASLAATQVYTHNTIEKLKETHRLAHPKA